MTLSTYLLYLAAVTVLILTPGPTMLMTVTNALNLGPARAMASLLGSLTASVGIMALSAAGMGAVLAASEAAFTVLKVVGAAYLIYLGVKTFRSAGTLTLGAPTARGGSLFMQGFMVGASNPKAILFFSAFFPQFIDPALPVLPQFTLLSATFVIGDFLMLMAAAFSVGRISGWLRQTHVVRWINRVCGGLFTVMGGLLLLSRKPG